MSPPKKNSFHFYSPPSAIQQLHAMCPKKAVKMVRGEMGLKNVEIMIPFVRTLEMAKDVNEVLASRLVNRTLVSRLENRRPNAAGVTRNYDFANLMIDFRSVKFNSIVV